MTTIQPTIVFASRANTTLRATYTAYQYSHKISAMGWYDTAQCTIAIRLSRGETLLDGVSGILGTIAQVYFDNGYQATWEGVVNAVEFASAGATMRVSLDEMYNAANATYNNASNAMATTATTSNTTSQSYYGIKASNREKGAHYGNTALPNALRDILVAQQAWPQVAIAASDEIALMRIELVGIFHTLNWELYTASTAANQAFSVILANAITAVVLNGTRFFDNTDTSLITTNALLNVRTGTGNLTVWQYILQIVEAGDGTDRWVCGITPQQAYIVSGSPGRGRRFYYRLANTEIEYTARARDNMRPRNQYGRLLRPWSIVPDRVMYVSDILTNWNGIGDDPREFYIETVEYDHNSLTVQLYGAENPTIEGVMRYKQTVGLRGKRNGVPIRITSA